MKRSESIKEIATALAKAQGKIEPAKKDSTNPHFKSRYADLASVVASCRGPLAENGLSIVQEPSTENMAVKTVSLLMHTSGEWIECETTIPITKADAQSIGSATTYGRRYGYSALVGVVADDDDDGSGASGRGPDKAKQPEKPEQKTEADIAKERAVADFKAKIAAAKSATELDALGNELRLARDSFGPAGLTDLRKVFTDKQATFK